MLSSVLKEVLSGEATEVVVERIHDLLTVLGQSVRAGSIPVDDFIIFKVILIIARAGHMVTPSA